MFTNIKDAIKFVESLKPNHSRTDLSRIKECLALYGNPDKSYKIVHVAGTNGKGSICAYLSNVLIKAKYKVGLFTSPYVITFNERIMIDGKPISDNDLLGLINEFYEFSINYKEPIPFFEAMFLMGLKYFKTNKVDVAIIECGIGGRLDSTNCTDKVCSIVSNCGYDHMNKLGNTLESILNHKLGIVRENGILFTGVDNSLIDNVIEYTNSINAKVYFPKPSEILGDGRFVFEDLEYKVNLLGDYQCNNACVAIKTLKTIFNVPYDIIKEGLEETKWPCRLEVMQQKPLVLIDGAHNISAINALCSYLDTINLKKTIVFTSLKDKEYLKMIERLKKSVDYFVFTTFIDARSTNENLMLDASKANGIAISDYKEAIKYAIDLTDDDGMVIIAGSLHFASTARKLFKKENIYD